MAFVDTYDPEKPFEEQIELPLEYADKRLFRRNKRFQLTHEGKTSYLSPTLAIYMALFMKDGYLSRQELHYCAHDPDTSTKVIKTNTRLLRKIVGRDFIKKRSGRHPYYSGGYFIGELRDHRNERGNMRTINGTAFNLVTGYVSLPNGNEAYLTPMEAAILGEISRYPTSGISLDKLYENIYEPNGRAETKPHTLNVVIHTLRAKLGDSFITTEWSGQRGYVYKC